MWFKNIQIFSLDSSKSWDKSALEEQLAVYEFTPCLPRLPASQGWVSPCHDDELSSLALVAPDGIMLCCQFEEKLLPSTVIQKELNDKIKELTATQERKTIPAKDKRELKETITLDLLPRAFTKLTRVYAYIDTVNNWLVLNTTNRAKTEQFIPLLQRTLNKKIRPFTHNKIAPILTRWLRNNDSPADLYIEKSCLLQDPQQAHRLIRCQEQNLFSESIQTLLEDGCEAKQLTLSWRDQVRFTLTDEFILKSIKFSDELLSESKAARDDAAEFEFQADFVLMSGVLSPLISELIETLGASPAEANTAEAETPEELAA